MDQPVVTIEPGTACIRCGEVFQIGESIHAEGQYGAALNLWYHDGGVGQCLTLAQGPGFEKVVKRLAVWALRDVVAYEYRDGDTVDLTRIADALDKL